MPIDARSSDRRQSWFSPVPLKEIGMARGKRQHDKRKTEKEPAHIAYRNWQP